MKVQTALQQGCGLLEEAGVPVARLTAEVLLGYALGRERAYLYAHPEEELTDLVRVRYEGCLDQRVQGKPTQYITRQQEFYGREFFVDADVLIPRPETEHVVETALEVARDAHRVVDVGCGSGAIAVTLNLEMQAAVCATDVSLPALRVARRNAKKLGAQVHFVACDLVSAIAPAGVDLVVSNPPYVPLSDMQGLQKEVRDFEPHVALFAGPTGLEIYERLVVESERVLRPGGALVVELGFKTSEAVRGMLGSRWREVRIVPDLAGIPRVLSARLA